MTLAGLRAGSSSGGGGGGGVAAVVAGTNVAVDSTDPTHPVVSAVGVPTPGTAGLTLYSNTTPTDVWEQGAFNVLAFGADPTGVADATTAFNAVFTALQATPGTHGAVYVPSGSYKIAGALTVPSGILMFGDGPGSNLNFQTQAGGNYCLNLVDCTLRDLAIVNTDASGLGTIHAQGGSVVSDCVISGNGANDPPAIATSVAGGAIIAISDCEISGVHLKAGAAGALVIGQGAGVALTNVRGIVFQGCQAVADPNMALVAVTAGVTKFGITDCFEDGGAYNYGAYIAAGASDHYIVGFNDFAAANTAAVLDGGSGVDKLVDFNPTGSGLANPMTTAGDMIFESGGDFALGRLPVVDSTRSGAAANLTDGNDATFWNSTHAGGTAASAAIDLGSAKTIASCRVLQSTSGGSPDQPQTFQLLYSDTATSGPWTLAVQQTTPTLDDTFSVPAVGAHRYWAIFCGNSYGGGSSGNGWQVSTWSLFGPATPARLAIGNLNQTLVVDSTTQLPRWAGDTAWTNVVGGVGFQNSWADAAGGDATTAFRKDATGRVDFRISAKSGASGSVMFTLPAGYRPSATNTFTGLAELLASNVSTEFAIASNGTVTITFVGSLTGNVYCTGSFYNGA